MKLSAIPSSKAASSSDRGGGRHLELSPSKGEKVASALASPSSSSTSTSLGFRPTSSTISTSQLADRVPIIFSSSGGKSSSDDFDKNNKSHNNEDDDEIKSNFNFNTSPSKKQSSSLSSSFSSSNINTATSLSAFGGVSTLGSSASSASFLGFNNSAPGLAGPIKAKENRPVSAQRRRPSIPSLDAIPENRSLMHRIVDSDNEIDLTSNDVDGVFTSSFDNRFPTSNINVIKCHTFSSAMSPVEEDSTVIAESSLKQITSPKKNPNRNSSSSDSGGGGGGGNGLVGGSQNCYSSETDSFESKGDGKSSRNNFWISTGMVPQFMMITLRQKWIFRKLEIRCHGVKSMSVMFDSFQTEIRKMNDNLFILETTETSSLELRGLAFKRITININEITGTFFSVNSLGIKALPYA